VPAQVLDRIFLAAYNTAEQNLHIWAGEAAPPASDQPTGKESDMTLWAKRILLVLVVGFFLFYLISQPEGAASAVRTVFDALAVAFRAIVRFFTSLAG
jgi:hypothetical protein